MENILNLKQISNLENAIESLSSSTNIHLVLKNETFTFRRLNAMKSSTSFMEYSNIGHGCSGVILLTNDKHIIVISNKSITDVDVNTNMPFLRIKPFVIKNIFDRLPKFLLPKWLFDNETLINVHFIERYNGKPNGEPSFDRVNFYYCNNSEIYKDFEMKDLDKANNDIANLVLVDDCTII